MGALLLVFLFQCCPSAAPEPSPPAAEPVGLNVDNPVPVGHSLTTPSGAAVTIQGIATRGEGAKQVAQQWSMVNQPDPGYEYVIIPASVSYEGGPTETLRVSYWEFRVAVGGRIFEHPFLLMEGNELEGEMFEGGSVDGVLVFEVPQGSRGIVVMYSPPLHRTYYFATE